METELRRDQISLYTLGTGIILFGAWSVVKALLFLQAKPIAELDLPDDPKIMLFAKILFFIISKYLIWLVMKRISLHRYYPSVSFH